MKYVLISQSLTYVFDSVLTLHESSKSSTKVVKQVKMAQKLQG